MTEYESLSSTKLGYYVTNDAVFFRTKDYVSSIHPFNVTTCDISAITGDTLDYYAMPKMDAFSLAKVLNCKVLVRTVSSSFREIKE